MDANCLIMETMYVPLFCVVVLLRRVSQTSTRTDLPIDRVTRPSLVRAIGRWSLTAGVINAVIGSGIFGLPSAVANLVGAWSPAAVLIAGCSIFIIILCFAEVGSRFEDAGGPYLYALEVF